MQLIRSKMLFLALFLLLDFSLLQAVQAKLQPFQSFIPPIPPKAQALSYAQRIQLAKQYINENKGVEALETIKPLLTPAPTYSVLLIAAQSYAEQNNPARSLTYYQAALQKSQTRDEMVVATQGVAKMQKWIADSAQQPRPQGSYIASLPNQAGYDALQIKLAQQYIRANKGKEALEAIKPLLTQTASFQILIITAQSYAAQNTPEQALAYYQKALGAAKSTIEIKVATQGIAKMQTWIKESQKTGIGQSNQRDQKQIEAAKKYINANQGKAALALLKPLNKDNKNYDLLLITAQAYAVDNNPKLALAYYKLSAAVAKTAVQKAITVQGIAKMEKWMQANNGKPAKPIDLRLIPENELSPSQRILLAREYIGKDNGRRALAILSPLLNRDPSYQVHLLAAKSYAELDRPRLSLRYYESAYYLLAANAAERIAAGFGLAKIHFWLSNYYHSQTVYEMLLHEPLDAKERELALAGAIKTLAYENRPILAYKRIPCNLVFKTPEMIVAAAQATLWANQADLTKAIMIAYQDTLRKVDPKSPLGRNIRDAAWQMDLNTRPNEVSPSFYFYADSETFRIYRSTLSYLRYWSQFAQTYVGLEDIKYSQSTAFFLDLPEGTPDYTAHIDATDIYLTQQFRPTRELIVNGTIRPTKYHQLWNPMLWSANAIYTPTDYFNVSVGTQKAVVETFRAMYKHIDTTQYFANLNLYPLPYVTLNGALNKLNFSDTNVRNGYYVAAQAQISTAYGVSVILQERGFTSKFVSPNYFSPNRYVADTLILRWGSQAGEVWHYYLDAGFGTQLITINGIPSNHSPTKQYGAGINGPLLPWLILSAYYTYVQQASSFIASPDYRYHTGGISLTALL